MTNTNDGIRQEELHHKVYPYPERFVWLVTGAKFDDAGKAAGRANSQVLVGRSPDEVCDAWVCEMGGGAEWKPMTCVSMADLRGTRALFENADAKTAGVEDVAASGLFGLIRMGAAGKEPWVVSFSKNGGDAVENVVVMASDAEDLEIWAKGKGISILSMLSRSVFEAAWEEMDAIRNGVAGPGVETYVKGPQDWDDDFEAIENFSAETNDALLDATLSELRANKI